MITTEEFVKQATVGDKVEIDGKIFTITEQVTWKMLRSGGVYHKYSLRDESGDEGYKFAEDPDVRKFILVHLFNFNKNEPFMPEFEMDGNQFTFSYGEVCVAIEVSGGHYKTGDIDVWCDYETGDGNYLSLGTGFPGGHREDLIGRWVEPEEVKLI